MSSRLFLIGNVGEIDESIMFGLNDSLDFPAGMGGSSGDTAEGVDGAAVAWLRWVD